MVTLRIWIVVLGVFASALVGAAATYAVVTATIIAPSGGDPAALAALRAEVASLNARLAAEQAKAAAEDKAARHYFAPSQQPMTGKGF
ncbi:MAG: hypothetical protein M0Z28_13220 [Rhodospirillales bacterium]|nr:hypothetical protein [Rhodospirillales bacterium]